MSKRANVANILLIMLAASILSAGLLSSIKEPNIVGMTMGSSGSKISQDVIDAVNSDGRANVIILLKQDDAMKQAHGLQAKQIKIKEKQQAVLSKLNYITKEQKNQAKKEGRDLQNLLKNKEFDVKYIYSATNALAGTITSEGLTKLETDANIEKIVLITPVTPTLTTSVPLIRADKVWGTKIIGINITGIDQTICIVDTGIDYTHQMLGSCTLQNVTEHKCKVISGYDFVDDDSDPIDDHGHGTHVAGIAAGNGILKGVAKGAKLVAIKVLNYTGNGTSADAIAGVDWCINNATKFNISVISMSLGDGLSHTAATCPVTMDSSLQNAIEAHLSVFAASGNDEYSTGINWPGCSQYLISVGASDDSDIIASFTNYYSGLDVMAPGVDITSSYLGGGTTALSGTSMATPFASGVAALIYQYEKLYNRRNATQGEVKNLLKLSNETVSVSGLVLPRIDAKIAIDNILKTNDTLKTISSNHVGIKFLTTVNLENVSGTFVYRHNFISLNSSKYPSYNRSVNITFYDVNYSKKPVIYRNGALCTDCRVWSFGENLTFNTTHFTNYTSAANSKLIIFDQRDAEAGSQMAKSNFQTYFYANYTNRTTNMNISGANCTIRFTDLYKNMTYNSTANLFEFNRTFFLSQSYSYNISCGHYRYETLNLTDSIFISPACINQTPNADIIINAGTTSNCTSETVTLRNQSIKVFGTLLLNNSYLIMDVSGTSVDNMSIFNNANLTVLNSTINGSIKAFTIYGRDFSRLNITSSKFLGQISLDVKHNSTFRCMASNISTVTLRDDSRNKFIMCSFSNTLTINDRSINNFTLSLLKSESYFTGTTKNIIKNSNLSVAYFRDGSYSEIQNSNISNITQLGNSNSVIAILNFTEPQSRVKNITELRYKSKIYGYVDMPPYIIKYTIPNSMRFYPIQVNYTDGTPVPNKLINVTNATNGIRAWEGYTDANGFATINITFTNKNKGYNYSIRINPEQNISLLTDTPIIFTLSDTTKPVVSKIKPNVTNEDSRINYNATVSDNTAVKECNLSINGVLNGTMSLNAIGTGYANKSIVIYTPGTYQFRINCTDASGNYNDSSITNVRIRDATPPFFNQTPTNRRYNEGSSLRYRINASDNVNLSQYWINDTIHFKINSTTGWLYNKTALTPKTYWINITINDTSNNKNSTKINITILDITPPVISNVNHSAITNKSAKINWTTNENSNTTLNYGLDLHLGTSRKINNAVILHNVTVTGLKNNTRYYYNVTSCSSGGCTTNGSFTFVTKNNTPVPSGDTGSHGGGGSGSSDTVVCETMWYCDLWSSCTDGRQTRLCQDIYGCVPDKTETQTCIVKQAQTQAKEESHNSGILEPNTKEESVPTAEAILEIPKSSGFMIKYQMLIWMVIGLFIALVLARRIDTFPLVLWKEEKYLEKKDIPRAEQLFDKALVRFGKSKKRERKYVEKVEKIALTLNSLEIEDRFSKSQNDLAYQEAMDKYKKALENYLSLPPDARITAVQDLERSKRILLDAMKRK